MRIGYACQVCGLSGYKLRSCLLKNASEEKLREIIEFNIDAIDKIIDFNIENGIKLFRIGSEFIPFASHEVNQINWWIDYKDSLRNLGQKIITNDIRVSTHPGQFTVLNSPSDMIVKKSIQELVYHTRVLDSFNLNYTHKNILHIGGTYGEKKQATKRFIKAYSNLPKDIKNRLIIENDEKNYGIEDVLDISEKTNIPVVFDVFHNLVMTKDDSKTEKFVQRASETWSNKDGKLKIHFSTQRPDGRAGSHSQTIYLKDFMQLYNKIKDFDLDIMLEVKDKNMSALKCYYCIDENLDRNKLIKEWERYRLLILSKSQENHDLIDEIINKNQNLNPIEFYNLIEESLILDEDREQVILSIIVSWEFFKNSINLNDTKIFRMRIEEYGAGKIGEIGLKNYLFRLAQKYNIDTILKTYYFKNCI